MARIYLHSSSAVHQMTAMKVGKSEVSWFSVDKSQIYEHWNTSAESGLSTKEVTLRESKYGPNRLPASARRGALMRFVMQINNMLIYVLIAAGVGKLFLGEFVDAGIIFAVVIINALLGFVQEGKAEKALESIRSMLSSEAITLRDEKIRMVPAEELVPGDIVMLQSGDKVPADIRLVEVKNLRIEEAPLTGESLPVEKSDEPVPANAQIGDRKCMAYSGTLVVSGRGKGVVIATGGDTELGHINKMLKEVKVMETPLLRQIEHFGKILTIVILIVCAIAFAYGRLFLDESFTDMFKAAVGIAVSAIPEGLPAVVTITLALGVQRMARRHAIIRRLPAVETLGSVSRICSDKTGTLTRNEMVVTSIVTATSAYEVTGEGYSPHGTILPSIEDPVVEKMARVSVLCNESEIHEEQGMWKLTGDPTEGALLPFAAKSGLTREDEIKNFPRTNMIPFESEHKFMATLHGDLLLVKGAPDVIMNYCDRQELPDGSQAPLDRSFWEKQNAEIGSQGKRVLALAWLSGNVIEDSEFTPQSLTCQLILLGLVGIMDPPREEAIAAVRECHEGGIRVTMITGDHAVTGASIAKMLGIGDGKSYVTGQEIEQMDDDQLAAKCRRIDVFARTSPEHKLRLVRAMQESGQVVSMTGDGVNDAPALKQADVGVAMGIKGTEVSKEAAEMVLTDDNFASITAAIREGRTVFNNIEKAILFMLPTNGGQALTILTAIFLGLTLPITPPQILWINMVSSITLAFAISFEPHELGVMKRPPRSVNRPLLDHFGLWRVAFISLLLLLFTFGTFFWLIKHNASLEFARTAAVNAMIIGQVFYLVNSRFLLDSCFSFRAFTGNKWIPISIGALVVLQLLFTYAPFMQTVFGTAPLPVRTWAWLLLGGGVFFTLVELEKILIRWSFPKVDNKIL